MQAAPVSLACKGSALYARKQRQGSRINRHSLRNGLRLIRALPGVRLDSHRPPGLLTRGLIPASGDQDHATSPSASVTFVSRAIRIHRIPAPRIVTIGRNVPLHRGGMRETIVVICPTAQAKMRAADWHDGQFGHGAYAGTARRACGKNTVLIGGVVLGYGGIRYDPSGIRSNAKSILVRFDYTNCYNLLQPGRFLPKRF
jgi:hypothetical protein